MPALATLLASCASGPVAPPPITPAERIQRDLAVGAGLARQFESRLEFKSDKEVLIYLHDLAGKLAASSEELKGSAVGVRVIVDRGARWRDYSIPGNRIYLSTGLLKHVQYENELAAAIALELAHVIKRHVPRRLQEGRLSERASNPSDFPAIDGLVPTSSDGTGQEIDFFSPTGVFAFPDEYFTDSVESAIGLLYGAGFDPRGIVTLWASFRAQPAHSPYEDDLLRKLSDKARTIIAQYSPLRNPIVRSSAFLGIQKRIQRL